MKEYTEMTRDEINSIIKRGGDDLVQLNRKVIEYLDSLELSDKARDIIADTDGNFIAECFGGLFTAEEVEWTVSEYCKED